MKVLKKYFCFNNDIVPFLCDYPGNVSVTRKQCGSPLNGGAAVKSAIRGWRRRKSGTGKGRVGVARPNNNASPSVRHVLDTLCRGGSGNGSVPSAGPVVVAASRSHGPAGSLGPRRPKTSFGQLFPSFNYYFSPSLLCPLLFFLPRLVVFAFLFCFS